MATCIVYIRKSSASPKKQVNSIDYQKKWAEQLLKSQPDLDVIWIDGRICNIPQEWFIIESFSAKESNAGRRTWFQHMISTIENYHVDYVISCYVSRISRNSADTEIFMNLLKKGEEKIHVWVITEGRTYLTLSPNDVMDLHGSLFQAKQDNSSKSIESISYHKYKKWWWIFTSQMPFWYDSLGQWWWKVSFNTEKAQLVRMAYEMRLNWCQWTEIAKEFSKRWYKKTGGNIKDMISNPIYYWEFELEGVMMPVKNEWYQPIIDKPTYDKFMEYEKLHARKHGKSNPISSKSSKKLLDKMVFDAAGQMLQWGITKGNTYYRQRNKDFTYKISIAESKLFREAWKQINKFAPPPHFSVLIEAQLREKLHDSIKEQSRELNILEWEIKDLEKKINGWIDKLGLTEEPTLIKMYEDKVIETKGIISTKQAELEKLKANKKDIATIAKKYSKLFSDLPWTYNRVSKQEKADILRWLDISFVVWPDAYITLIWWTYERLFNPNLFKTWIDKKL